MLIEPKCLTTHNKAAVSSWTQHLPLSLSTLVPVLSYWVLIYTKLHSTSNLTDFKEHK